MCIRDSYKSVLCHGWVVDEQGKQMHKSAGNGVEPSEIIKDYGADIIRLWVAASDYTVDVRAGKNIFKQLSEAYRKIRNTARFILGNLDGFDPNTDCCLLYTSMRPPSSRSFWSSLSTSRMPAPLQTT